MHLQDLPTELLSQICMSCFSLQDLLALSVCCRQLRSIIASPGRKLRMIGEVLENQYGPLQDAIQLVTHNASQAAHTERAVPASLSLYKQIVKVGCVAARWEELYPFKRWRDNYEDRRLLTGGEKYILRRAVYRLWLYSKAFHNSRNTRYMRSQQSVVLERARLLHNWSSEELAEISDLQAVVRETVRRNICPSNGTIQQKFRKRFPDGNHQLMFNMHLNYPLPPIVTAQQQQKYKFYTKYRPTQLHEPGAEGWGDDPSHYYIVEDMMKLDPGQVLWLKDNAPTKRHVEAYLCHEVGLTWFDNNGETFAQTLEFVLDQRGMDLRYFLEAINLGAAGVARKNELLDLAQSRSSRDTVEDWHEHA